MLDEFAWIKPGIFFLEAIDTAGRVDQFLLPGKERMALGTDFNFDVLSGGSHVKCRAACTGSSRLCVFGMDVFFHLFKTPSEGPS